MLLMGRAGELGWWDTLFLEWVLSETPPRGLCEEQKRGQMERCRLKTFGANSELVSGHFPTAFQTQYESTLPS